MTPLVMRKQSVDIGTATSVMYIPSLRTLVLLWAVAACYAAFIAWKLAGGYADAARGAPPLYTDYTPTYAASMLMREVPAEYVYLQRAMSEAGKEAARAMYGEITTAQARGVGFAPFMYPPTFLFAIAPLAYLPYLLSWFAWLGMTALPYLAAIRQILPGRLAWPFALAMPPVFYNVIFGQTGFLTAGLIGLGLTLLQRSPVWAGVLIGLASVKPHFGILIPIALMAGGHWRAFGSASITVIAMILGSALVFGDEPWFAFIGTSLFHLGGFGAGAYSFRSMTTVLSAMRMSGASIELAWLAQHAMSIAMVSLVAWVWWRGRTHENTRDLQAAVLCLATPLAIPMAYHYDLVLIVPAIAWIWRDMWQDVAPPWEKHALLGTSAALLSIPTFADTFAVQVGPVLLMLILGLAFRRYLTALDRDNSR